MRKIASLVLMLFVLGLFMPSLALADHKDDFQAIKKAIKENPEYKPGQEVKWFKVLITDNKTKKEKVKITLPITLVEALLKCSHQKHMKIDSDEWDIDLKEIFEELKKHGPMVFIEVYDEDEDATIKVWVE